MSQSHTLLIWLIGIVLISSLGSCTRNKVFDNLFIEDSSFNLILTSNLDCNNCIDNIIYGERNSFNYYGFIFSPTSKKDLSDFSYVFETQDWITWDIIQDKELFLKIIELSSDKNTPIIFEVRDKKIVSVRSLR